MKKYTTPELEIAALHEKDVLTMSEGGLGTFDLQEQDISWGSFFVD